MKWVEAMGARWVDLWANWKVDLKAFLLAAWKAVRRAEHWGMRWAESKADSRAVELGAQWAVY